MRLGEYNIRAIKKKGKGKIHFKLCDGLTLCWRDMGKTHSPAIKNNNIMGWEWQGSDDDFEIDDIENMQTLQAIISDKRMCLSCKKDIENFL